MGLEQRPDDIVCSGALAASTPNPDAKRVFDRSALLERLEGDEEFLREIVDLFLRDAPLQIEKLRQALREGDTALAQLKAHSLKGAAANFAAEAFGLVASRMEMAMEARELESARSIMAELEREYRLLESAISASTAAASTAPPGRQPR